MKRLFLIFLLILSVSFTYADSNGIWNKAEDIRAGIFGFDEEDTTSSYVFNNPVSINNILTINTDSGRGIFATSSVDDGVAGVTLASGKSAIYGFANNAGAYSGYFEGGKFVVGSGNVGIGTDNPMHKLDVVGDIYMNNNKVATESFVNQKFDLTKPSYVRSDSCLPGDNVIAWRLVASTCTGTSDLYKVYYGDQPGEFTDAVCPGTSCTTSLGTNNWVLLKPSATTCNYSDGVYGGGWGTPNVCSVSSVVKTCSSKYMALCEAVVS